MPNELSTPGKAEGGGRSLDSLLTHSRAPVSTTKWRLGVEKLLVIIVALCLAGCDITSNQIPNELLTAKRPITIVVCNDKGVILQDANGRPYAYQASFYFVQTLSKSELKPGDVFLK